MKAFAPLAALSALLYLVPTASAQPARSSAASTTPRLHVTIRTVLRP